MSTASAGTLLEVARALSPGARELAALVSPAPRIEPELLRAIRLAAAPEVDAGCEADLWFGPLVESRGVRAVSLRADIATALREELAERWRATELDRERLEQARLAMLRVHAKASPALVLEERLAWLVIAGVAGSPLEDELWPAVAALEDGRLGVARWAVQAWSRFPAPVRRTPAGVFMHAVAMRQLARAPAPDAVGPVAGEPSADWDALIGTTPRVPLLVAWSSDALLLGRLDDDDAVEILVPDLDPIWLEVTLRRGDMVGERIELRLLSGERRRLPAGRSDRARIVSLLGEEYELARPGVGRVVRWISDVVTLEKPLGPHAAEPLVSMGQKVFRELYDETNVVHRSAQTENPFFIFGRKGAGKTAFLVGTAYADGADVVLIKSEDVYGNVNALRKRYIERNGPLVADELVHVWEVLLFHAAMLAIARSEVLPDSPERDRVWVYLSAFGDPAGIRLDDLLAAVCARVSDALIGPRELSFRHACWTIETRLGPLENAAEATEAILARAGSKAVYVVVDNLEDLHRHLEGFADVITALFRLPSRSFEGNRLPFRTRFAFPAELVPRLSGLAANPEKDFQQRLTVRWSASDLIVIAGNRLRTFLDLYFRGAAKRLGLPAQHDHRDRNAAETTLRAVLPPRVTNGLGKDEDPVAYMLRHTQLLPRHLILIMNEIMSMAVVGLGPGDVPRATERHVVKGVQDAELLIVSGILATYHYEYQHIAKALKLVKNQLSMVEPASNLHRIFNKAGGKRAGMDFDEFVEACLAIGALGVVIDDDSRDRYVQGRFSYTFTREVSLVEDRDDVCVHPLFVPLLFDDHAVAALARAGQRAVYPHGPDPIDLDHDY